MSNRTSSEGRKSASKEPVKSWTSPRKAKKSADSDSSSPSPRIRSPRSKKSKSPSPVFAKATSGKSRASTSKLPELVEVSATLFLEKVHQYNTIEEATLDPTLLKLIEEFRDAWVTCFGKVRLTSPMPDLNVPLAQRFKLEIACILAFLLNTNDVDVSGQDYCDLAKRILIDLNITSLDASLNREILFENNLAAAVDLLVAAFDVGEKDATLAEILEKIEDEPTRIRSHAVLKESIENTARLRPLSLQALRSPLFYLLVLILRVCVKHDIISFGSETDPKLDPSNEDPTKLFGLDEEAECLPDGDTVSAILMHPPHASASTNSHPRKRITLTSEQLALLLEARQHLYQARSCLSQLGYKWEAMTTLSALVEQEAHRLADLTELSVPPMVPTTPTHPPSAERAYHMISVKGSASKRLSTGGVSPKATMPKLKNLYQPSPTQGIRVEFDSQPDFSAFPPTKKAKMSASKNQAGASSTSKRTSWTEEEEQMLEEAMQKHGTQWSMIVAEYGPSGITNQVLARFNQVQLKDKARNIRTRRERAGLALGPFSMATKYPS